MNKQIKKLFAIFLAFSLISYSPVLANTSTNNEIYEKSISIDLENLDLSVEENSLNISSKFRSIKSYKDKSNLLSALENDPNLEKELISAINSGATPLAISSSERYIEELVDSETNEITSRFLTNAEVKELNNPTYRAVGSGEEETKGKLTLRSAIVTGVGSENTYSLSLSASWDISGYNGSGENSPAEGDDFIGLCWPSSYSYKGISNAEGYYYAGSDYHSDIEFYKSSVDGNAGISWGFKEKFPSNYVFYGADSITAFAHIVPNNSDVSYKTFTAEYIHTYQKKNASVSISPSSTSTSGGLSISNVDKQWKIVSPLTLKVQ